MPLTQQGSMKIYVPDGCLKFGDGDTTNDYIISDGWGECYIPSGSKISMSCWYKHIGKGMPAGSSWNNLIGKDEASLWGISIDTNDPPCLLFHGSSSAGTNCPGYGSINTKAVSGVWTHIVGTYNGGDRVGGNKYGNIYINGELKYSTFMKSGICDAKYNKLYIGSNISGLIHDCRLWSGCTLTANEVKQVYNGLDIRKDKLVVHYRFGDRKGTKLTDSTSFNNSGTIVDCLWHNRDIKCWCNRWDEGNWDLTTETMLDACDRNYLFSNVTPGAQRELYNVLGLPKYIDTTYKNKNTLIVEPLFGCGVSSIRERRVIACKNINDSFINRETFTVKIEGVKLLDSDL